MVFNTGSKSQQCIGKYCYLEVVTVAESEAEASFVAVRGFLMHIESRQYVLSVSRVTVYGIETLYVKAVDVEIGAH